MTKRKREWIEWLVLIAVVAVLYFTGLGTVVMGSLQRVVLAPGLIKPEILSEREQVNTSFSFYLKDENGERRSFEEFKGKTVFLNVWATWCPPCIAEMPDIHSLYEEMKGDSVEFVMISRDADFSQAIEFVIKKGYDFPIYSAVSRLPPELSSRSIPSTFVISPEGYIVAKKIGMAKYNYEGFQNFLREL